MLVDDLEQLEGHNEEPHLEEKFSETSEGKYSDFSITSSKRESSVDSFEELRNRALRLKQTLKF